MKEIERPSRRIIPLKSHGPDDDFVDYVDDDDDDDDDDDKKLMMM
jgi:hypothetical protein